jgi:hypothetical protein
MVTGFDRDVWEGRKPTVDSRLGPHTIGTVALAAIGHSVWTDTEKRRNAHDDPMGGVVLDIVDQGETIDDETGEIRVKRAFRCYDPIAPWGLAFATYTDDLIAQEGVEATPDYLLTKVIRRFCAEIAKSKRGLLTSSEADLLADAHHLAAVLMGGHTHA